MKKILGLLLLFGSFVASAQTVTLADTNLRNKLLASYPQVMLGNQLSISAAAALTGSLDLRHAQIRNASEVAYFTSITTLNLSQNKLTTIPDLSATTNLVNFYATDNRLETVPNMSALTQLRDFQVMNNQLTTLPEFPNPSPLRALYCSGNKITKFPSLTQFPQLVYLVIGNNLIDEPIDFSSCINLQQLHVHQLQLDTIIGLEKLQNLTILYAWGNKIKSFSGLDSLTKLVECVVFDNAATKLPYLENKPALKGLDVNKCYLTFEDIIPVFSLTNKLTTFTYSPQKKLTINDVSARAESTTILQYPAVSPLSGNYYVWSKDGIVLDSSTSPQWIFNPLKPEDAGEYSLRVYNQQAPNLILSSNTFRVSVQQCIEFRLPDVTVISKDCILGYTIDLSNAQIAGGTPPFTYILSNKMQRMRFTDELLERIPAGKYELSIVDSRKCSASQPITLNRIEQCDPVLTPNDDGIADFFFIETPGTIKIYDLKRNLVNTLEAPINWNGTDQNGALLDAGYYIIMPENGKPIYVTLIR